MISVSQFSALVGLLIVLAVVLVMIIYLLESEDET